MTGLPHPGPHHLGERISALADGELPPAARDRALAHVAGCDPCRAALDAQRRTKAAVSESPWPPLPAGLEARLLGLGQPGAGGGPDARAGETAARLGRRAAAFPVALPAPGRPAAAALRRPSPYGPARAGTRRTLRRATAIAGGTLSVSGLAIGAAFWLGFPSGSPGAPLQPPVDAFLTPLSTSVPAGHISHVRRALRAPEVTAWPAGWPTGWATTTATTAATAATAATASR